MPGERAPTPGQMLGPFQHPKDDLRYLDTTVMALPGATGRRITLRGRVVDTSGAAVPGAVLEVWQATSRGKYHHPNDTRDGDEGKHRLDPNLQSYIRLRSDAGGWYSFTGVKPGGYPAASALGTKLPAAERWMEDWVRAPHIHFRVRAEGFAELATQLYFADEVMSNEHDLLQQVLTPAQRRQLRVELGLGGEGEWDIVLSKGGYPGTDAELSRSDIARLKAAKAGAAARL